MLNTESALMPRRGRHPGETVTIGFRIDAGLKAALERAAAADHRTMTSLVEKLITDHVRAHGYLEPGEGHAAEAPDQRARKVRIRGM